MSSKLTKKKVSTAPPLPRVKKRASIVFEDGLEEGTVQFDLLYEPDGIGDQSSLAHRVACKANELVKVLMDSLFDKKTMTPETDVQESAAIDQASNIITPPRLVQ